MMPVLPAGTADVAMSAIRSPRPDLWLPDASRTFPSGCKRFGSIAQTGAPVNSRRSRLLAVVGDADLEEGGCHDRGAEKHVSEHAVDGPEAKARGVGEQVADAHRDSIWRPAEGAHHQSDEEGDDQQLGQNAQRRIAEEAGEG